MARESPTEKKFLDEERTQLAEERTLLSYVRTFLAVLAIIILFMKLYFEQDFLTTVLIFILTMLALLIIFEEVLRFRRMKKKREKIEKL